MLLGGDEWGRTQNGNNNAWCQDNDMSWFDWERCDENLLAVHARLVELRREHPVFRRMTFFEGKGELLPDVWWMRPDGRRMTRRDWDNLESRAIGVFLNGDELQRGDAARRGAARRFVPDPLQRVLRRDLVPAARSSVRHTVGRRAHDGTLERGAPRLGRRGDDREPLAGGAAACRLSRPRFGRPTDFS